MVIYYKDKDDNCAIKSVTVNAGETVLLEKGEIFRPTFPVPTEYNPVCSPAFHPSRCTVLEEAEVENGSKKEECNNDDVMYHMCEKKEWAKAVESQTPYFPPTFEEEGFIHATSIPQKLIDTANQFYTNSKCDDWICLKLSRSALTSIGIVIKEESPVFPHIYGGISTKKSLGLVTNTYPMTRNGEDGTFVKIVGVTD